MGIFEGFIEPPFMVEKMCRKILMTLSARFTRAAEVRAAERTFKGSSETINKDFLYSPVSCFHCGNPVSTRLF
jgi:hypothetical protein